MAIVIFTLCKSRYLIQVGMVVCCVCGFPIAAWEFARITAQSSHRAIQELNNTNIEPMTSPESIYSLVIDKSAFQEVDIARLNCFKNVILRERVKRNGKEFYVFHTIKSGESGILRYDDVPRRYILVTSQSRQISLLTRRFGRSGLQTPLEVSEVTENGDRQIALSFVGDIRLPVLPPVLTIEGWHSEPFPAHSDPERRKYLLVDIMPECNQR